MKGFGSAVSPDYVKRVATISAKTMVWVSLIGFILNGAWFFFDDFLKTLIQEIVILTATILSVINLSCLEPEESLRQFIFTQVTELFSVW